MSILHFFQGMSVFNIGMGIVILSYIGWTKKSNAIYYDDWRRILLLIYSYGIIATYVLAMIWMGRRSILLFFLAPWFFFLIFSLPLAISLILNIFLFRKTEEKENEKLDITTGASSTLIVMTYLALILNVLFLLFTMRYQTYISSLILSINDVTTRIQPEILFSLVHSKHSSCLEDQKDDNKKPSQQVKKMLEELWEPKKNLRRSPMN